MIKKTLITLFLFPLFSFASEKAHLMLDTDEIKEDKVIVQEFFYYGCPHCKNLEKSLGEWKKTLDLSSVKFEQVPVDFGYLSVDAAKHHYVAEMFELLDVFKEEYFHQVINKKNKISDNLAIEVLFRLGANKEKVVEAMNSFKINKMVKNAQVLSKKYKILEVPSFVINGKYYTSVSLAKSEKKMFDEINALINK
jgi:protein dithiol oxidoreductase (disulfide-forming)